MAVAAEKERSPEQKNTFVLFENMLAQNWYTLIEECENLVETVAALPRRVKESLTSKEKARIPQFDVFQLYKRYQELLVLYPNPVDAIAKLSDLAREDLRTYYDEYVRRRGVCDYTLLFKSNGGNNIFTNKYHLPLLTMAQHAVDHYKKIGRPASRMQADLEGQSKLAEYFKNAPAGKTIVHSSPKGNSYLGKGKNAYSFVFVSQVFDDVDGVRRIENTQYKVFGSNQKLVSVLRALGCSIPPDFIATERTLASSVFPVETALTKEQVLRVIDSFPIEDVPANLLEAEIADPGEYTIEEETVLNFVERVIKQEYIALLQSHSMDSSNPKAIEANRKIEVALNVGNRRLREFIKKSAQGELVHLSEQELMRLFERFVDLVFNGKTLDGAQRADLKSDMEGALGALGSIASWGQCGSKELFDILIGTGMNPLQQMQGIPLNLMGKTVEKHGISNCPTCGKNVPVTIFSGHLMQCDKCLGVNGCFEDSALRPLPTKARAYTPRMNEVAEQSTQKRKSPSARSAPEQERYSAPSVLASILALNFV